MLSSLSAIKIALQNTQEPIDISVSDSNGVPTDATVVKLTVMNIGGNILFTDDFADPTTNIIKVPGQLGYYYYPLGVLANQTTFVQDLLFQWTIQTATSLPNSIIQNVEVVSARSLSLLPYFRLMIDKSRKLVDTANDVFLGYTDSQLMMYIKGGIQIINGYQPETACGFTINNFPWDTFRHIGLETALMSGVMSQQLFAIDTDNPAYSDQGISFTISHAPQLASFLQAVCARLDKAIPLFKLQFVTTGSLHVQMGGGFGLNMLVNASPTGSIFRNMYVSGG